MTENSVTSTQAPPPSAVVAAPSTSRLQLVNCDGDFVSSPQNISKWLGSINMLEKGTKYFVVGIMGAQSSGKSTLLNLLFGTEFDELDASTGRQMTTKGVWLGSSPLVSGALVMDLEGTDSVSRGSERHPFERQSALLGLSVAEVLIINMWQHDIGRYVASNYGVLATVFGVNLELLHEQIKDAAQRPKTMLMFCIRDHVEHDSPLDVIASQLTADTKRIWNELKKPDGLEDLKVEDVFDLSFVALPHKRYESEKFNTEVGKLRERFANPSCDEYLLSMPYHFQKSSSVPSDGLGLYLSTIWDTIRNHKDLNLPSQKEMLASFRCDELLLEAVQCFTATLSPVKARVKAEAISNFGTEMASLLNDALNGFMKGSDGYHDGTVQRKAQDVRSRLLDELRPVLTTQLRHCEHVAVNTFRATLQLDLPSDGTAAASFTDCVNRASTAATEALSRAIDDCKVGNEWDLDLPDAAAALQSALETEVASSRAKQVQALRKESRSTYKHLLAEVRVHLEACEPDMWQSVTNAFATWLGDLHTSLDSKLEGLGLSEPELEELEREIINSGVHELQEEVTKQASFIKLKLQKKFDTLFRLDETGLPRKWHNEKDIRVIFVKARDEALLLLDLYRTFVVKPIEDKQSLEAAKVLRDLDGKTLLSGVKLAEQKQAFMQDCEHALRGAEAAQARAFEFARTPVWVFPLIAILGFNEFMAVLTSPLLMFCLVLVGIAVGTIYYLNLTGPVIAMTKLAIRRISSTAFAIMEAWAEPLDQPVQSQTTPSSATSTTSATARPESTESTEELSASTAPEPSNTLRKRVNSRTSSD